MICLEKISILHPVDDKINLRILADRTSIEIFGNSGWVYMPMGVILNEADQSLAISATGGEAQLASLEIYQLKSIW
jgi:sucrose-6-phosphate hydrolase SacC (GH32 family)